MIIDNHVHFGPALRHYEDDCGPLFPILTVDDLLRVLDRDQIEIAVIFPPRWIGGSFFDPNYEQANQAISDAVKKHPDRLIGYGRVNPNWGKKAVAEAKRCFEGYGLRGLKLHPEWESFFPTNATLVDPLMEVAEKHKVVVLFHTGYFPSEPALFIELALRFPRLPIILGHMGGRLTGDAVIAAKKAPNLLLETSGSLYSFSGAIKAVGAERFLFGSNCPFEFPKVQLEKLERTPGLSAREREGILWENSARLHGIKHPSSQVASHRPAHRS
jgi:uncharacterized protein